MAIRRGRKGMKRRGFKPRRRAARKPTVNVNRALAPIPQRYITKMKYANTVLTNADGNYIFELNSLFAPQGGQTGEHQPYGFDQFATLYNRYRVIACGWRVQVPKTDTIVQVAAQPGNSLIGTNPSFSLLKERSRTKYVTQMPGGNVQTIISKAYLPSICGRNKAEYMADDRYQALVTASPVEDIELLVKVVNAVDTPVSGAAVNILFEYTVEFFDVKNQAQS